MRDAVKVAEKQIRNASNNVQSYLDGVANVSEAPGARAVKKQAKLKANFNAAVDSGKWAENTSAVGKDEWIDTTVKKGGERFGPGVEAARDKIIAFQQEFQPFIAKVKAELDTMPDATPENRKAKMLANFDKMSKFRKTRRRR